MGQVHRRIRRLVFVLAVLMAGDALAIACDAVFSNAVGTTDGKLELKDDAALQNTGDRVLATGELKTKAGTNHCDNQACIGSGVDAPTLTIPAHRTKTDLKDQSLILTPGDYYFDKFELKHSNTITIIGPGQVRIHVLGKLKIEDQAQVNVNGNPLDLIFLVDDDVEIKDDAQVNAIIYAEKEVKVKDSAVVEGALVGKKAKIEDDATVIYTPTDTLEMPGICELGGIQLDHIRITHDGIGVIGQPESVILTACANADCSEIYTGSITVELQPVDANTSWSGPGVLGNQVTFTGGEQEVTLNRTTPGTFDIGLTGLPSPQNPNRCFIAGSESCSITFAATDLIVSLPDQVSGGQSLGSVSLPSCFINFQSVSMPIDVVVQYVSPATPGPTVEVNGSALPNDGSATTLNLDFDASCVAPLQVEYADAGQIALELTFNGTGTLAGVTLSGADTAAFYPAALIVTATKPAGTVLNAASATAGPIHAAGEAFTLQVRAVNTGGAPTPRYEPQADDRLLAYVERTGPTTGGSEGSLSIAITGGSVTSGLGAPSGPGDYTIAGIRPTDFGAGEFKNEAADYSEVGLVTLYLLDSDYFGHTVSAAPLAIGRFVPAGFSATPGTVDDRFLLAGCGDPFTYMDEPLRVNVTLTALNADGLPTRNYLGDFAKFPSLSYGSSPGFTLGARSNPTSTNLSGRITGPSATIAGWTAGVGQMAIDLRLASVSAPDGPYPFTQLGLIVIDSDGVGMRVLDLDLDVDGDSTNDFVNVGETEFRRGRLSLGNAHGSELRDLAVPVAMQFFDAPNGGFRVNPDDNCTPITNVDLSDADAADGLAVADTCIVDAAAASGTFACASGTPGDQYTAVAAAGRYVTSLRAPGAAKTGALRIRAVAPAYAKFNWFSAGDTDPIGLGTFGIYNRDTEVIYQREVR